jgi:hypothetical protein
MTFKRSSTRQIVDIFPAHQIRIVALLDPDMKASMFPDDVCGTVALMEEPHHWNKTTVHVPDQSGPEEFRSHVGYDPARGVKSRQWNRSLASGKRRISGAGIPFASSTDTIRSIASAV